MTRLSFSKFELALYANVKTEIDTKSNYLCLRKGRALSAPRTTQTLLLQDILDIPVMRSW